MNGAALVAIAATVGNFLQGWDNATIAGAILYIKKDLQLGAAFEGLIVATSLVGAALITTCSGALSDCIGRRPMLILSSVFYFLSGLIMLWSPNVYVLLLARLLDGFGIGLAVTLIPLYISETAPSEIRGLLNTLPQFIGSGGMFLAYCMIFGMSLTTSPSWRLILGVLSVPSLLYFALTVLYLPESPRWLVSKGRMLEAKRALQKLRGREDVSGELALLVEGLGVGCETSIEEYIICRTDELHDQDEDQELAADNIFKLYGPEDGLSWIAKPVTNQSRLSLVPRQGRRTIPLMDPLVTLFGNFHEKISESGSMRSMLFPNLGSMFSIGDATAAADGGGDNDSSDNDDRWDEESLQREGNVEEEEEEGVSDVGLGDTIQSPLISRQTTSLEKDMGNPQSHGTVLDMRRHSSLMRGDGGGGGGSVGIGGGWHLAWKWTEQEGEKGNSFKRVYLHEEITRGPRQGSLVSIEGDGRDGEYVRAAALLCQPALYSKEPLVGPAMSYPLETAGKVSVLDALLEPGVKRALILGIGIQILQQFSGINGVLYHTPQLFKKAGVEVVLSNLGIESDSSYFLSSAFTNFLMLPSIAVAMRFMDSTGRRPLLLRTIPILVISLIVLIIANTFNFGTMAHAIISTVCIMIYSCMFAMGYGPIPNILCSEIFPTRVRGICIAICALAFWICNVVVTYTLPLLLGSIGLGGIFGIYAVVCVVSWIFIFLRVPETKGMPLEVITEFFAVGAKQERS